MNHYNAKTMFCRSDFKSSIKEFITLSSVQEITYAIFLVFTVIWKVLAL